MLEQQFYQKGFKVSREVPYLNSISRNVTTQINFAVLSVVERQNISLDELNN